MATSIPLPATPLGVKPPVAALRSAPAAPVGAWRYPSARRSRGLVIFSAAVSATFHLGLLFGVPKRKPPVVKAPVSTIQLAIAMPLLKELEEPERVLTDDDSAKPDLGQPVPMQADVPAPALPTDFVQQFDFASLVERPDLSDMKMLTLPENIRRPGKLMEGVKIFDLSSLDRIPEAITQTPPIYPVGLRREALEVTVKLLFHVEADGRVTNVHVTESTDSRFNDAAVLGVSKWRFRAGIKDGRKVVTRMTVPITFRTATLGEDIR